MIRIEIKDEIRCFIVSRDFHCLVYVVCPDHIDNYIFLCKNTFEFHFEEKIQKKIKAIYGDDVKFERPSFKDTITLE